MSQVKISYGEEKDVVEISSLRVLIDGNDVDGWMAQGLEIDYFACAKTEDAVKRNFVEGFAATIATNVAESRDITGLLIPAPPEVWQEYYQAISNERKTVDIKIEIETVEIEEDVSQLPFNKITFLKPEEDKHPVVA